MHSTCQLADRVTAELTTRQSVAVLHKPSVAILYQRRRLGVAVLPRRCPRLALAQLDPST